jgi:WD40 repeat protein/Flp pilus assembly protein TadD
MAERKYEAFISYKHGSILPFAQRLARSLRTYATGLFARPRNIFRDEDHLVPTDSLPELIHRTLENSAHLLLLASPEAASSPWVDRELRTWCGDLGRQDRLVIVLVDGSLEVDASGAKIDWHRTNAVPPVLRDYLRDVPLFVDLRGLRSEHELDERNPVFKAAVAKIVARLVGVDPQELIGYEIAQHRRRIRIRNGAIALLAGLTVTSLLGGVYANIQRLEQRKATYAAMADALSAQVRSDQTRSHDERNALLARQAYLFAERSGKPLPDSVNRALQTALSPDYFTTSKPVGAGYVSHLVASDDGQVIAVGGDTNLVRIWDARMPGRSLELPLGTADQLSALALDRRGRQVALAVRGDGSIRLWSLAEMNAQGPELLQGHEDTVQRLVFDAEGRRLVSASDDGTARVWNLEERKSAPQVLHHSEGVVTAAFVGDHLLTATRSGALQTWSAAGASKTAPHSWRTSSVGEVEISRSGQWLAMTAFGGSEVRLYDLSKPSEVPVILKAPDEITTLTFAPGDDHLAAGTSSGEIVVWVPGGGDEGLRIPSGHGTGVTDIAFAGAGRIVSSGQQDGQMRIRYLKPVSTSIMLEGAEQARFGATDDEVLALKKQGGQSTPSVWKSSAPVPAASTVEIPEAPGATCYPAKGRFVSMSFKEKSGVVWPATPGSAPALRFRFPEYSGKNADGLTLSGNGRLLAWVDPYDVSVWLVDLTDPNPAAFALHNQPMRSTLQSSIAADGSPTTVLQVGVRDWSAPLAFSRDNTVLAVGARDGSVRVWTLADRTALPHVLTGFGGWPLSVAFSGDSELLAVGSTQRTVGVWSFRESRMVATLRGHAGRVDAVAFAPNRRLLATGGPDQMVRLWDLQIREPQPVVLEEAAEIDSLEFSPSGQKLLVSLGGGSHVWTVSAGNLAERICAVVSRNLSLEEWRTFVAPEFQYERTCENLPVHPSLLETAQELARTGALRPAKALISQAIHLDPQYTAGWSAELERSISNAQLAEGEEVARSGDPEGGAALMKRAVSRGATLASEPEAHAKRLAAEGLLNEARRLTRAKDADKALTLLDRSIQLAPSAGALAARGELLSKRGEKDKAISDFDRALLLDPSGWDLHAERAQLFAAKNDWKTAIQEYSRALELLRDLELESQNIPANKLGVADKGTLTLLRAKPAERDILAERAQASAEVGDFVGAIADYGRILSTNPKDAGALYGRAVVYRQSRQCDKAIADLTATLDHGENDWRAYTVRGLCWRDVGSYDKGLRDLEVAATLNPGSPVVQDMLRSYRAGAHSPATSR